jgi:hypothetical protein
MKVLWWGLWLVWRVVLWRSRRVRWAMRLARFAWAFWVLAREDGRHDEDEDARSARARA